jgi:WD40 repeat protein
VSTLSGHSDTVRGVCFSPDGSKLASCSDDLSVKIWNLNTGECASTLNGWVVGGVQLGGGHSERVNGVCFSPDGSKLASCSDDWSVKIWNLITRECVSTLSWSSQQDGWGNGSG